LQWRLLANNSADDKEKFNEFMRNHPKGHILQTWEWGELKAKSGWWPLRLVIEEDNIIIAAISLLKRQLPTRLGSLFYATRGPVLDIERKDVWDYLFVACRELAAKHNAIFLKIDPDIPEGNELWQERIRESGFVPAQGEEGFEGVQPRHVFRLDIRPDKEELLLNLHQKTRYNLRLAEKKGVVIENNAPRTALPRFYKLLQETATRDKFLIRPYSYYEAFYDILVPAGMAEMFLAHYEGELIAGTLAFILGKKAWYIYGASANNFRNVMPNYLIQWRMIEWAKEHNCTLYDFRGVPGDVPPDHPLYGLVKFKKGFGGEYTSFIGEYDLVFHKAKYKFYHWLEPKYQKWIRRAILLKKRLKKLIRR
jgi:lipid II:glycine glycyltransferase (peptidoglycan interpeptide bridge formation enzyme)